MPAKTTQNTKTLAVANASPKTQKKIKKAIMMPTETNILPLITQEGHKNPNDVYNHCQFVYHSSHSIKNLNLHVLPVKF